MGGQATYMNQRESITSHQAVLEVHDSVLRKHAELHQLQAKARDAVRVELQAFVGRSFLGRLRWLLSGK